MTPDDLRWPLMAQLMTPELGKVLSATDGLRASLSATDRHRMPSSALSATDCLPHQVLTALFERLHTRDAEAAAREDALIELLREHGASLPAVLGAAPPARADYPQQFPQPEAEPAFAAD